MVTRNSPRWPLATATCFRLSRTLAFRLGVLVIIKVCILLGIWHLLLKDHKIQGHAEATATYFLTPGAKPQLQTTPRSPWE